jgi:acetamidase/formamidase
MMKHICGPSGTLSDGKTLLNEFQNDFRKATWDLAPFIGTIATAPDRERVASITGQGPYGGNLDCRDIREGTRLYLPVFHDGGLLFCGDVHASQGDTEFYGWADECPADVTFNCDAITGNTIHHPRLEKPSSLVSVCSSKPLEEAVRKAVLDLMDWMISDYGMSPK